MSHRIVFAASALAIALSSSVTTLAEQPFFMGLGDLPGGVFASLPDDISADGTVVVGSSSSSLFTPEASRWTRETGMVGLGRPDASYQRVSADGSTAIGAFWIETGSRPIRQGYRWTSGKGEVLLPPNFNPECVSGDGSVVIGDFQSGTARWTEAGGVEFLSDEGFPGGVQDISADGSVILGNDGHEAGPLKPFIWSATDGVTWLNLPPSAGLTNGNPGMMSDDGKVVIGWLDVNTPSLRRGFRWTKETGAVELGFLPDGLRMSATGVSADGSFIVGNSQNTSPQQAAIWDAAHGPRYLADILTGLGLGDALRGWSNTVAWGISGDGRSVIGSGINPQGNGEGWIACLGTPVPEPSTLLLTALVLFLPGIRRRRPLRIASCKPPPLLAV
jgi:uncharacterized membrane protein